MKKISLIAWCMILIPAAALAQEKTLYAIGQEMVTLVEAYAACAAHNTDCTEQDALALQSDAENSLRDLTLVLRSGSLQRIQLTASQAQILGEQAKSVRARLSQSALSDGLCNWGVIIVSYAISAVIFVAQNISVFFMIGLLYGKYAAAVLGVTVFSLALIPSIGIALGSFVFLAPCLFWWL